MSDFAVLHAPLPLGMAPGSHAPEGCAVGPQHLVDAMPLPCWLTDVATGRRVASNALADEMLTATDASSLDARVNAEISSSEITIDGRLLRMFVAVQAPKGLLDREAQLRRLIDGSVDIIYETDEQGCFTFVSAAVEPILGYAPAELLGSHYSDLIRADWRDAVARHYGNQRSAKIRTTLFELPALSADGRNVWLSQNVQPVVEDGAFIGFRGVARDVTERHLVEERFRTFIENSPTPTFMKDDAGRYVFASQSMERLFVPEGQSIIGRTMGELVPSEAAAPIDASDREVFRSCRPIQVLETLRVADGTPRHWLVQKFPVASGGRTTYVGGIAVDLTERIALERELANARDAALTSARDKSQFLANMSHEIRTPMNGVLGLLGVLADTPMNDDQRDLVHTARESAESLLSIINDILDYSKIEAGKLSFEVLEFDVRAACDSVIDILTETARSKGLEIGCVIDPQIPRTLRGDPGRLRQVLLNLVGNALKFTTEGGVLIQVDSAHAEGDRATLRFQVTDTGIGIPAAVKQSLFTPFTQGDASTTRRFGGTGLGLAISRELVRLMDGEIGVESEPGCGSTFWFTAVFTSAAGSPTVQPVANVPRVLVVEDSTVTRQLVTLQLTAWRVPNEAADTPIEALSMMRDAAAAGTPFDLVLTDLQMPDMDGAALARIVQQNEAFGNPRIVLMSSANEPLDAAALTSIGITTSLRKPLKPQHLFRAVFGESAPERRHDAQAQTPRTVQPDEHVCGRVLVADDNPVNQKVALRQLQKLGYAADAVSNGLEAIEALARGTYDLVLMDCQMPELDGYAATARIRAAEGGGRHIPIVALTASASETDRQLCLAAGMDDFVPKPVREPQLRATLERWIGPDHASTPAA